MNENQEPSAPDEQAEPAHALPVGLTDGLLMAFQALVMCLQRSGALDTAELARLLADMRNDLVEPGSYEAVVVDRVLMQLVDQPEVLVRRRGLQLVPTESPGPQTTPEA